MAEGFDCVIVGSGAAGATAARTLVDTGASVAVIEEGPAVQPSQFGDTVWPALRDLYRDKGTQMTRGPSLIRVMQGSCLGGSTVVNSAIVWRMPEAVWSSWRQEHGLGQAVPYAELERNWEEIERELNVQPTPREVWGENNRLLETAAQQIGVRAASTSRYVTNCRGSARCQLGCPHGAKQSMLVSYLPYALQRGATILTSSRAERVLVKEGRAVAVQGRIRTKTGLNRPFVLHARKAVLLAASAIQTPGLLARSGVRSPHLGRHFQAHPGALLIGVFGDPVNVWFGATQGFNVDQHLEDWRCKVETLALPPEIIFAQLPGVGPAWLAELARSGHTAAWDVVLRADAEGSVREGWPFGGPDIRFKPSRRDINNLRRGLRFTADLLFAAGARQIITGVYGLPDLISSPEQAALFETGPEDPAAYRLTMSHLFGTARMSMRPEDGVVGPDFQMHSIRRLYVVDSSVFPTNLGVNPQHTIMAMASHATRSIAEATR